MKKIIPFITPPLFAVLLTVISGYTYAPVQAERFEAPTVHSVQHIPSIDTDDEVVVLNDNQVILDLQPLEDAKLQLQALKLTPEELAEFNAMLDNAISKEEIEDITHIAVVAASKNNHPAPAPSDNLLVFLDDEGNEIDNNVIQPVEFTPLDSTTSDVSHLEIVD